MTQPTPFPDVNAILAALLAGVQAVLGDDFVGMYLYGSLAVGDFNPDGSDIDFVVVTTQEVPDEMLLALQALHARLGASDSPWATELEGSYIPRNCLRRYDPTQARHPHIDRGGASLDVQQHDYDWVIQRHGLREHGVVIAGPAPVSLIDPIPADELRRAVLAILRDWWAPMLQDQAPLHKPGYRVYAILTMCRMLYTLQQGTVVSKPVAARWAQVALGGRWTGLIQRALAWPHDEQSGNLDEALDFIRYTIERSRRFEAAYAFDTR